MGLSEKEFVEICKKKIEVKMDWFSGTVPKQRDFEFLLDLIEEKSKIRLSLSTIKRIWNSEGSINPQISTLNALAIFLDYTDWSDFKKDYLAKLHKPKYEIVIKKFFGRVIFSAIVLIFSIISVALLFIFFQKETSDNKFLKNISVEIVLPKTTQLPQNVIFKYQIKDTGLTNYHIQPYYNPAISFKLDKSKGQIEIPYSYPSRYTINLISESEIIQKYKVKIATDSWISIIFNLKSKDIYFDKNEIIANGKLAIIDKFFEQKKANIDSFFYSGFYLVDELPELDGDNFIFEAKLKCLKMPYEFARNINIGFRNENFMSSFPLIYENNINDAECKFGNRIFKNTRNLLQPLVCDIYEWQTIRYEVTNRKFKIFINNELKIENFYFEKAGNLDGFCFVFPGLGAVDYVKLRDLQRNIVYENDFD